MNLGQILYNSALAVTFCWYAAPASARGELLGPSLIFLYHTYSPVYVHDLQDSLGYFRIFLKASMNIAFPAFSF